MTGFLLGVVIVGAAAWFLLLNGPRERSATADPTAATVFSASDTTVSTTIKPTLDELRELTATLAPGVRQQLLDDPVRFAGFVRQQADRRSLLAGARANQLHENPSIKTLMEQGANKVLMDSYLRQLLQANLPEDFPNESQFREYYEKNTELFRVPERVQLWQIYLPTEATNEREVLKQAGSIRASIVSAKLSFAEAAARYSKHQPSNRNGGNMGALRIDELLPEVKDAVLALKEGVISQPIKTDTGVHIIKRGERISAQNVSYEDAKPYINQRLLSAGQQQVLEAVMEKLRETYPADLSDDEIEFWRLQLLEQEGTAG
jgi:parvulin-like peptidyl-prolyl isomerase